MKSDSPIIDSTDIFRILPSEYSEIVDQSEQRPPNATETFMIRHNTDPRYFFIRNCFMDSDGDYIAVIKAYTRFGGRYSYPRWTMDFSLVASNLHDLSLAARYAKSMHDYTDGRSNTTPADIFTDDEKRVLEQNATRYKDKQEKLNDAIRHKVFGVADCVK